MGFLITTADKLFIIEALSQLMRSLKLIARFYSRIFLINFLVTLSCIYSMRHVGDDAPEIIGWLFLYKVILITLIFYIAFSNKRNEQYYYQNLGVSKWQLVFSTTAFDVLLWMFLIIIQLLIGIPAY